uniref:Uncharacterized protein n=1 Tax=Plectus sambesii TaxID=2011161 RepID=A0A914V8R5_9BILA
MAQFANFLLLLCGLLTVRQLQAQNCSLQIEEFTDCLRDRLVNSTNKSDMKKRVSFDTDKLTFEDASSYCMKRYVLSNEAASDEWAIGMKLEALDRLYPSLIVVATVTNVNGNSVSITFDNWGDKYDYTTEKSNRDLHPVGYAKYIHHPQNKYKPYKYPGGFNWKKYLNETDSVPVPFESFNRIQTNGMPKDYYLETITGNEIQPGT